MSLIGKIDKKLNNADWEKFQSAILHSGFGINIQDQESDTQFLINGGDGLRVNELIRLSDYIINNTGVEINEINFCLQESEISISLGVECRDRVRSKDKIGG